MKKSRLDSQLFDQDFGLMLGMVGATLLPFRVRKNSAADNVFLSLLKSKPELEDKRFSTWLLSNELDFNTEPASIYEPERLKESVLKYFSGVNVVRDQVRNRGHEKYISQALSDTFKAFRPQRSVEAVVFDFKSLAKTIKLETSSGYPNYGRKGDNLDYSYNRLLEVTRGEKIPSPCTSFFRTQRIHGSDSESKVRLVWGYPIEMTMLEGMFARPLIDYYVSCHVHPIAMGWTKVQVNGRLIKVRNANWQYSLDYSQFDARIPNWFIQNSFSWFNSWMELDAEQSRLIKIVRDYFINTPLLTPWGIIKGKDSGIPSGSYFTQIIGSMYNYFLIALAHRLEGLVPMREGINVLGDDSAFGCAYKLKSFDLISDILKCQINVEKSHISNNGRVHFLGRYYQGGFPHVDPKASRTKLVFPERNRNITWSDTKLVIASYLLEGVENAEWINKMLRINYSSTLFFNQLYSGSEAIERKDSAAHFEGSKDAKLREIYGLQDKERLMLYYTAYV